DSKERIEVMRVSSNAVYVPPGYLLFQRNGTLMAQRFDVTRFVVSGEPTRVADRLAFVPLVGSGAFATSSSTLAYRSAGILSQTRLTWYDRSGRSLGPIGSPGVYRGIALSPDGKQIAVHQHQADSGDIWVLDLDRGAFSRFTIGAAHNVTPAWS